MIEVLLIILICLVITGFGWLALDGEGDFKGGSLFQLIKWVYVYGFMIAASAIPLVLIVLFYRYFINAGF